MRTMPKRKTQERECGVTEDDARKLSKSPDWEIATAYQTCELQDYLQTTRCLDEWNIKGVLGVGTVGTVLGACTKRGVCAAVKISRVTGGDDVNAALREVMLQKIAYPYAPKIYSHCFFEFARKKWSAIVMERIDGELDKYLTIRRPRKELVDIEKQLNSGIKHLCKNNMTHGDLVYFNIAYKVQPKSGIRVLFIDFDRATDQFCDSRLDVARLILELYPAAMTPIMKAPDQYNQRVLLQLLLARHADKFTAKEFEQLKTAGGAERLWTKTYNAYCRLAAVKCLE